VRAQIVCARTSSRRAVGWRHIASVVGRRANRRADGERVASPVQGV
jgi:hypothetical protein